jgi:hypothetical protein
MAPLSKLAVTLLAGLLGALARPPSPISSSSIQEHSCSIKEKLAACVSSVCQLLHDLLHDLLPDLEPHQA